MHMLVLVIAGYFGVIAAGLVGIAILTGGARSAESDRLSSAAHRQPAAADGPPLSPDRERSGAGGSAPASVPRPGESVARRGRRTPASQ